MTAAPRFTEDELVEIIDGTRFRTPVMRDSGPDHDSVDVLHPHNRDCRYRFARDATGCTYLLLLSTREHKLLVSGKLTECLALLKLFLP